MLFPQLHRYAGMAGEVQLSSSTFELIKDKGFVCKVRGKVAVKGKGEMVTYLLTSSVEVSGGRRKRLL